jgi:hypothetical protein
MKVGRGSLHMGQALGAHPVCRTLQAFVTIQGMLTIGNGHAVSTGMAHALATMTDAGADAGDAIADAVATAIADATAARAAGGRIAVAATITISTAAGPTGPSATPATATMSGGGQTRTGQQDPQGHRPFVLEHDHLLKNRTGGIVHAPPRVTEELRCEF